MLQTLLNQSAAGVDPFKLGQTYLTQARECKGRQDLHEARYLFTEAKEAFKKADKSGAVPKNTVHSYLAQAYLERGDVLYDLGLTEPARASYQKANPYSQEEAAQRVAILPPPPPPAWKSLLFLKKPASVSPASVQTSPAPAAVVDADRFFQDNPPPLRESVGTRALADKLQSAGPAAMPLDAHDFALDVIEAFAQKQPKTLRAVREIVPLATIPDPEIYQALISSTVSPLAKNSLLDLELLQGLAVMIRHCPEALFHIAAGLPGDLVKVLEILKPLLDTDETAQL